MKYETQTLNSKVFELNPRLDDLFSFSYSTLEERERLEKGGLYPIIQYQRLYESTLIADPNDLIFTQGQCIMCGQYGRMITSYSWSAADADGKLVPNWREHLTCACGFQNRLRAAMHFVLSTADINPYSAVYVTERVTQLYDWLAKRFPNLIGSEFLGENFLPGTHVEGIRHEDLCSLSFPKDSFDLIMSFDVLEHVVDVKAAIEEIARVIRPGGKLVFQAPTIANTKETLVRARRATDGSIEHLLPVEMHGNPVNPEEGALCYRYLGVDTLDLLRTVGFSNAKIVQYWSSHYGYLGKDQLLFYAIK